MGIYQRPMCSDELMHWAKGQRAKNHKYIAIKNGRYVYDKINRHDPNSSMTNNNIQETKKPTKYTPRYARLENEYKSSINELNKAKEDLDKTSRILSSLNKGKNKTETEHNTREGSRKRTYTEDDREKVTSDHIKNQEEYERKKSGHDNAKHMYNTYKALESKERNKEKVKEEREDLFDRLLNRFGNFKNTKKILGKKKSK